jgi:hypothetical protein
MKAVCLISLIALAGCAKGEPVVRTEIVTVEAKPQRPALTGCDTRHDAKMPPRAIKADLKDGSASEARALADRNQHREAISHLIGKRDECKRSIDAAYPENNS